MSTVQTIESPAQAVNALAGIFEKAWGDEGFKSRLLSTPKDVLSEAGLPVPANVLIHEDRTNEMNVVLPSNAELAVLAKTDGIDARLAAVFSRASMDPAIRARLLTEPKAVVEEITGFHVPNHVEVKVFENDTDHLHVVLPQNPNASANGELSDEQLESVAGGKGVDTQAAGHASGALGAASGILGTAAAVAGATGVGAPVAIGLGVASGLLGVGSALAGWAAGTGW